MTRLVSLDFETTGTVPGWENEPWQLGCVAVFDGDPLRDIQCRARAVFVNGRQVHGASLT